MRAKEFVPVSKPRNFVAKNQQTAGAGAHKDKKRAEKQGDVKHKAKQYAEGVAEATSLAVRMQRAADKQRAKSDASLARTPSSIPKKEEPKKQGVAEVSNELRNKYVSRASDDYSSANFAARASKSHPGLDDYSREQEHRAKKRAAGLNRALSDKRSGRDSDVSKDKK